MIQRILSAIVAIIYLTAASIDRGSDGAIDCALFLILPMACIWFSEGMGSGVGFMGGRYVDTETPGGFVAFGGWLVLLMPVIVPIILYLWPG